LDGVVDPSSEVSGREAEKDRERNDEERGQPADDEGGPAALQREEKDVVADA
jgi:hypothetical protein